MSTTSCPRCSGQVTLPLGVRNDAMVRCPLCHAHYSLADALVNMPPILEVVENADEALPAEWLDEGAADRVGKPLLAGDDEHEDELLASARPADDELETVAGDDLELNMDFDADEAHEDSVVQDKDTEVEELAFSTFDSPSDLVSSDPLGKAPSDTFEFDDPEDAEAKAAADLADNRIEDDDLALDLPELGGPADAAAETIEFAAALPEDEGDELKFDLDEAAPYLGHAPGDNKLSDDELGGDELGATLDFNAPVADAELADDDEISAFSLDDPLGDAGEADPSEAATLEFGAVDLDDDQEPVAFDLDEGDTASEAATVAFQPSDLDSSAGEPVEFDFDAPEAASGDGGELRGFEDIRVDASGEAEDIPLDLPTEAVPVAVSETAEDANGKKGKKKKEKKPKAARPKGKRTLVGTLVSIVLPALLAVPLSLYALTWVSPSLDILGFRNFLPSAMLPADTKKPRQFAQTYALPPAPAAEVSTAPPETPAADADSGESAEHTAAKPPTDDLAAPAEDPAPSLAPAEGDAAPAEGDAAPADGAAAPTEEPAAPAEAPGEVMPSDDAPADAPAPSENAVAEDKPAADPFDELIKPAEPTDAAAAPPAEEMPSEAPAASDDPFAPATPEPAPAAPEPAADDDLFAPAPDSRPADADPAMPEDAPGDDPFAPTPTDPAAPAPETPAPETPAEPEAPETRPATDDPFAPAAPAEEKDLFAPDSPAAPEAIPSEPERTLPGTPSEELPQPAAAPAVPEPAAEALGPRGAQPVSPAEVAGAMQSTMMAGQQLMAAEAGGDEAALRKARASFYVTLFGAADAITHSQLKAAPGELDPQLAAIDAALRQQLAADPKRMNDLKVFSARWLGFPKRTTNGIALAGTVESAEQVGNLYHTKAKVGAGADATSVTIVTAQDPGLAAGDEIVSLGSIVENPQQQLAGYEGSEPSVVWSGMTVKVE